MLAFVFYMSDYFFVEFACPTSHTTENDPSETGWKEAVYSRSTGEKDKNCIQN